MKSLSLFFIFALEAVAKDPLNFKALPPSPLYHSKHCGGRALPLWSPPGQLGAGHPTNSRVAFAMKVSNSFSVLIFGLGLLSLDICETCNNLSVGVDIGRKHMADK